MEILIIVPTYNERENIEEIIHTVLNVDKRIEILVVDDNSPDATGEIVDKIVKREKRVKIIHREKKMGLGSAYVRGFKYALEHGYDYIFEMDADFSHNPADIPSFLDEMKDNDLVLGSRYAYGISVVNWPISRLLLSYFANLYARKITGVPVHDLTGGFKCFRREALDGIDLTKISSGGYAFQIEIDYKVYKKGFRVKEIPITFIERKEGSSKMTKKIIWEAFFLVWRLRIESLFKKI